MKNYDVICGIAQYFTPFCLRKADVIHLPGHARSYLMMSLPVHSPIRIHFRAN